MTIRHLLAACFALCVITGCKTNPATNPSEVARKQAETTVAKAVKLKQAIDARRQALAVAVDPSAAKQGDKPAAKDGDKPAAKDGDKPAAKDGDKPAAKDGDKPAANDGDKPAAKDGDKPDPAKVRLKALDDKIYAEKGWKDAVAALEAAQKDLSKQRYAQATEAANKALAGFEQANQRSEALPKALAAQAELKTTREAFAKRFAGLESSAEQTAAEKASADADKLLESADAKVLAAYEAAKAAWAKATEAGGKQLAKAAGEAIKALEAAGDGGAFVKIYSELPALVRGSKEVADALANRKVWRLQVGGGSGEEVKLASGGGAPIALGTLPLDFPAVPAGSYKLMIGDLTIPLTLAAGGGEHGLALPSPLPAGMVWVPAAGGQPAFLADKTEVTHADFARYIKAVGGVAPSAWPFGEPTEAQKPMPFTPLTIEQARDYAAWAGKRLPTADEWKRLAAGSDVAQAIVSRDRLLATVQPVTTGSGRASSCGAQDAYGNVAEYVEVPGQPGAAMAVGGSYASPGNTPAATLETPTAVDQARLRLSVGLRCVSSLLAGPDGKPLAAAAAAGSADDGVRIAGLLSLPREAASRETLAAALSHGHPRVRAAAGFALRMSGTATEVAAYLQPKLGDAAMAARATELALADPSGQHDPLIYPRLTAAGTPADEQKTLLQRLGMRPRPAIVNPCLTLLRSQDVAVRRLAIQALERLGPDHGSDALTAALKPIALGADANAGSDAVRALVHLQGPKVEEALIDIWISANPNVRGSVIRFGGQVGAKKLVTAAGKRLDSVPANQRGILLLLIGLQGGLEYGEQMLAGLRGGASGILLQALTGLRSKRTNDALIQRLDQPGIPDQLVVLMATSLTQSQAQAALRPIERVCMRPGLSQGAARGLLAALARMGTAQSDALIDRLLQNNRTLMNASLEAILIARRQAVLRQLSTQNFPDNARFLKPILLAAAGDGNAQQHLRKLIASDMLTAQQMPFYAMAYNHFASKDDLMALLRSPSPIKQQLGCYCLNSRRQPLTPDELRPLLRTLRAEAFPHLMLALRLRRTYELLPDLRKAYSEGPAGIRRVVGEAIAALEIVKNRVEAGGAR